MVPPTRLPWSDYSAREQHVDLQRKQPRTELRRDSLAGRANLTVYKLASEAQEAQHSRGLAHFFLGGVAEHPMNDTQQHPPRNIVDSFIRKAPLEHTIRLLQAQGFFLLCAGRIVYGGDGLVLVFGAKA